MDEERLLFKHPEITEQPSANERLRDLDQRPTFKQLQGMLGQVELGPGEAPIEEEAECWRFGSVEVIHGDIFSADAQAVILPMMPSLMPYRGLALEVFDRGGRELVEDTFAAAEAVWAQNSEKDAGLQPGDAVVVKVKGQPVRADSIVFAIVPWFWQGSPMDAAKRFRFCVRRAFRALSEKGFSSVAVPNLGGGVCGYEPRRSCAILMEEAVEAILQMDAEVPTYALKRVSFVDNNLETAESLNAALTEVAHRWLPQRRLTTAPQYHGEASRRLIVLPENPTQFLKMHPVKFKRKHGVVRNQRMHYMSNIKPWLWRAQRVSQPPPLMVFKQTGDAAPREMQLRARPFYFRGITHWLFPHRRTGYHMLRKSAKGEWVANLRNYRVREDANPRL